MVTEIDVKSLRTGLGLTQVKFAEALGVSQSVVSQWEKKGAPKRGAARQLLLGFVRYGASAYAKDRAA
jgi:DNA-binding transcriptional regulator YiaG